MVQNFNIEIWGRGGGGGTQDKMHRLSLDGYTSNFNTDRVGVAEEIQVIFFFFLMRFCFHICSITHYTEELFASSPQEIYIKIM